MFVIDFESPTFEFVITPFPESEIVSEPTRLETVVRSDAEAVEVES